jgi:hypothetical protein
MKRRALLKRGLLGGALLALAGGFGLALRPGAQVGAPRRPLHVVSARAFPVLVAVAGRVLDGVRVDVVEIAHAVDFALMRTHAEGGRDFDRVLLLLENALPGLLLRGSATPFTAMTIDEQDRALIAWRDSPLALLRGAYHALRKLCLGAHYATPAAWADLGYAGPMLAKDVAPVVARGPLSPPFDPNAPGASP